MSECISQIKCKGFENVFRFDASHATNQVLLNALQRSGFECLKQYIDNTLRYLQRDEAKTRHLMSGAYYVALLAICLLINAINICVTI